MVCDSGSQLVFKSDFLHLTSLVSMVSAVAMTGSSSSWPTLTPVESVSSDLELSESRRSASLSLSPPYFSEPIPLFIFEKPLKIIFGFR